MDRRRFIGGLMASTSALAVSALVAGCAHPEAKVAKYSARCGDPFDGEILRIDAHCHLLNHDDVNAAAFLTRRYIPDNLPNELAAGLLVTSTLNANSLATRTIEAELADLKNLSVKALSNDVDFCKEAHAKQYGLFVDTPPPPEAKIGEGRMTGFTSNRIRNAAYAMTTWPTVDAFIVPMIDFYEGDVDLPKNGDKRQSFGFSERPETKAEFYQKLHIATRGRFLPLISFNPARQIREEPPSGCMTPLELVRYAIEECGFVGVKLHPSTGYNPIDNADWGCPNGPLHLRRRFTGFDALGVDRAMERLYEICDDLDAPILVHGSDGLTTHETCMHGTAPGDKENSARYDLSAKERTTYRDPTTWTNAPQHWAEMLRRHGDKNDLRVCIAHYASRFQNHLAAKKRLPLALAGLSDEDLDRMPWLRDIPEPYHKRKAEGFRVEYDDTGELVPSAWLQGVLEEIEDKGNERMWMDLSFMVELAYSAASDPDLTRADPDFVRPYDRFKDEMKRWFIPDVDDGGVYARAFTRHLASKKRTPHQIMYGSDYHMPDVSVSGPAYMRLIESVIPNEHRERVMGLNAVEFFGLGRDENGRKRKNRKRLEEFYERKDLDLKDVRWIKRLEDQEERIASGRLGEKEGAG